MKSPPKRSASGGEIAGGAASLKSCSATVGHVRYVSESNSSR